MTARHPELPPVSVYRKTAAGRAELDRRSAGLSPRQRQLLVLVDGRRSEEELAALIGGSDVVAELLAVLRAKGLVADAVQAEEAFGHTTVQPAPAAPPAPHPVLPDERLAAIHRLMKDSARQHLGLLARELDAVIEHARCARTLQAAVARWHLALRDSRTGHAEADALLGAVRALIDGGQ